MALTTIQGKLLTKCPDRLDLCNISKEICLHHFPRPATNMDIVDLALNEMLYELDLDKPCCSEDWERFYCQVIWCRHKVARLKCPDCKTAVSGSGQDFHAR